MFNHRTRTYLGTVGVLLAIVLILAALFMSAISSTGDTQDQNASGVQVSQDATVVKSDGVSFAFSDFSRANKGTNKRYVGTYVGYRYPLVGTSACVLLAAQDYAVVYIPKDVAQQFGIDITNEGVKAQIISMLKAADAAASAGGQTLSDIPDAKFTFTSDTKIKKDGATLRFGVEVEESAYYATVRAKTEDTAATMFTHAASWRMADPASVSTSSSNEGLAGVATFLSKLDWQPLWVSLRTTGTALVVIFILGLLAAWGTMRASSRWKGLLDTIFTIPMVLSPTVCGFLLLLTFGKSTGFGRWLISHGIDIVFTWPAAVIACIVVAFPLMYRTSRGAFEVIDESMLDAARTLGWSERRIFTRLMLPMAWPSIAAGTVLAFARAMGEFGATLFFAGNYAGVTQTIPIAIYFDWMSGDTDVAIFWVIVVIVLSFMVIAFVNRYAEHSQRWKELPRESRG